MHSASGFHERQNDVYERNTTTVPLRFYVTCYLINRLQRSGRFCLASSGALFTDQWRRSGWNSRMARSIQQSRFAQALRLLPNLLCLCGLGRHEFQYDSEWVEVAEQCFRSRVEVVTVFQSTNRGSR